MLRIDHLLPLLAGLLLGLILISVWAVFFLLYQIVKQQGRLLLRLDGVEEQLKALTPAKPEVPAGCRWEKNSRTFRLAILDGNKVSLEDFRGKRVLLVNWSPNCGFCVRIAEELGILKQVFPAHNVELALPL